MASSEGRHEIEAARKRLAAAKERRSSTLTNVKQARAMLAVATKNSEHARSMDDSAASELQDAKKCLKESEERWEVIDVDASPDKKTKKRRRVSGETKTGEVIEESRTNPTPSPRQSAARRTNHYSTPPPAYPHRRRSNSVHAPAGVASANRDDNRRRDNGAAVPPTDAASHAEGLLAQMTNDALWYYSHGLMGRPPADATAPA